MDKVDGFIYITPTAWCVDNTPFFNFFIQSFVGREFTFTVSVRSVDGPPCAAQTGPPRVPPELALKEEKAISRPYALTLSSVEPSPLPNPQPATPQPRPSNGGSAKRARIDEQPSPVNPTATGTHDPKGATVVLSPPKFTSPDKPPPAQQQHAGSHVLPGLSQVPPPDGVSEVALPALQQDGMCVRHGQSPHCAISWDGGCFHPALMQRARPFIPHARYPARFFNNAHFG